MHRFAPIGAYFPTFSGDYLTPITGDGQFPCPDSSLYAAGVHPDRPIFQGFRGLCMKRDYQQNFRCRFEFCTLWVLSSYGLVVLYVGRRQAIAEPLKSHGLSAEHVLVFLASSSTPLPLTSDCFLLAGSCLYVRGNKISTRLLSAFHTG